MKNAFLEMEKDLIADEGIKLRLYKDTFGNLTIGVGRNLDARGITTDEAMYLLRGDITVAFSELHRKANWWKDIPREAQRGLLNMCFNLGWPRLKKFKKMLAALQAHDYQNAADEARNSLWYNQVGSRAERIARRFEGCVK